jgi:hypothetical protein
MSTFHFPQWTNHFKLLIPAGAVGGVLFAATFIWLGFSPKTIAAGYEPKQPVPFSHALHAGELGMDCRYCHNTVEEASHAAIPPTATCMNCHSAIHTDSTKLAPVRESYETGKPIEWVRVHDLPDYAYFNHSAHVRRGVSCVSCHGRIDQMEVVKQQEPLSMGWCLECHRNPEPHLRPLDQITNLGWTPPEDDDSWKDQLHYSAEEINPQETCSTCHR